MPYNNDPYTRREPAHRVGEPVVFVPTAFTDGDYPGAAHTLNGEVIGVNEAHRHYTVAAPCNGYILRESYKF